MSVDSEAKELPIDSLEDFIRRHKLVEWPETIRKYGEIPSEHSYNSVEEIEEYFRSKVPFPVEIATFISRLLDEVWERVQKQDVLLPQAHTPLEAQRKHKEHPYPELVAIAHKKMKEQVGTAPLCPDIMDFKFPGFSNLKQTDIPGLPNTSQHLDRISEAQCFNPGFLKIWKPFFLSEHSIAVFKDTFWWFFLHSFKPRLEDESALFDRIASGFVSLLLMVQNDVKDKLFKVYADCLAQAVYAAFCGAFPKSLEHFDDNFKTMLAELTSLWVSGLKPKLFSWKSWKLTWLTPVKDVIEKKSVCDFQMDLNERIASAQTPATGRRSCGGASAETNAAIFSRNRESHYIGPGPQFDHICFKPWGQSPLVARYLQLHGIPSTAGSSSRKIKRTEIATVPPERPTYQEVIIETQDKVSKWRQNYKQFFQQTNKEISVLHKKKQMQLRELKRDQMKLNQSHTETKICVEGILNKWDHATPDTRGRHQLETSVGQKGDSDDSRNTEESPKSPKEPGKQA